MTTTTMKPPNGKTQDRSSEQEKLTATKSESKKKQRKENSKTKKNNKNKWIISHCNDCNVSTDREEEAERKETERAK